MFRTGEEPIFGITFDGGFAMARTYRCLTKRARAVKSVSDI
jgi:hypothetical protein